METNFRMSAGFPGAGVAACLNEHGISDNEVGGCCSGRQGGGQLV